MPDGWFSRVRDYSASSQGRQPGRGTLFTVSELVTMFPLLRLIPVITVNCRASTTRAKILMFITFSFLKSKRWESQPTRRVSRGGRRQTPSARRRHRVDNRAAVHCSRRPSQSRSLRLRRTNVVRAAEGQKSSSRSPLVTPAGDLYTSKVQGVTRSGSGV